MRVSIGSTGAPTLQVVSPQSNQGILSIARNSAGKYTITLTDPYVRVLQITSCSLISTGIPASADLALVSDSVSSLTTPALAIQYTAAGVATDPASGEVLLIQISLKNSSIM